MLRQSVSTMGNGMRLTAAEIQQLRVVPDLVFINCCYLGVMDVKPEANKLAASISMELIKMGVRAGEGKRRAACVGHLEFATAVQPAPPCPESRAKPAGPRPNSPLGGRVATVASRNSVGGVER